MVLGLPIGQHISIGALIVQPSGAAKEIIRSYTPITGDDQPGYFDLLVKSYPQGNMTQHLASLVIGQSIRVRGPKGAFTYEPNMVRRFGMIAGGTGITPMLHIIRAILRGRKSGDVTGVDLVFANVNEEDILLRAELDAISKEDGDIRVHHVLNNPPEGWAGGVGFVSADMFTVSSPPFPFSACLHRVANASAELDAQARQRYKDLALRAPTHGERHEENCRGLGVRKGTPSE
jgi:cytochrome-b5 reductase